MAYEQDHTKDEILEDYLNIAFFGDGAYGIAIGGPALLLGARRASSTLAQSALLAGLVQNPTRVRPHREHRGRPGPARRRAAADGRARASSRTSAARKAMRAPLGLDLTETAATAASTTVAPFFCDYVRGYLLADPTRWARPGASARRPAADRRADHPHHHRPALPAGGRRGRPRAGRPDRPGHRRAGDGASPAPARCGRSRSHGRWATTSAGRDLPQLSGAEGVRRRQRASPAGRRSRCSCWPPRSSKGCR